MRQLYASRSAKAGLAPGTPVYIGSAAGKKALLTLHEYTADYCHRRELSVENLAELDALTGRVWLDIEGVSDTSLLRALGSKYNLHELVVEDIANTDQRPKVEDSGESLFLTLKMLGYNRNTREIVPEQLSMILKEDTLLTFQEGVDGDPFDAVRERLQTAKSKVRENQTGFLAYALLDAVVDNYFLVLEELASRIEDLEDDMTIRPEEEHLAELRAIKKEIIYMRRTVWPLRDVLAAIERSSGSLFGSETLPYLRDVYDHVTHIIDSIESYRDLLSTMQDTALTMFSNRLNEIMKVLTIISTVVMPLTLVTGIYGMNFQHMPELHQRYGYPVVLVVMLLIVLGMFRYFRRKKWI